MKLFPGLALFQELKITIGQDKLKPILSSSHFYLFSVCIESEDEEDEVGVPADLF